MICGYGCGYGCDGVAFESLCLNPHTTPQHPPSRGLGSQGIRLGFLGLGFRLGLGLVWAWLVGYGAFACMRRGRERRWRSGDR